MMNWRRLMWQRSRSALGLVLTLVALVCATTAVLAGTVGYTGAAAATAARAAVAASDSPGITIRTQVADDPEAQDALARQVITEIFAPAAVSIERTTEPDGDRTFVMWSVLPDMDNLKPDDLPHYAQGADAIRLTLRSTDVPVLGVTVEGDLATSAGVAARNLAASEALSLIPLSVMVLVTVLAVVQVARLLAGSREAQMAGLVARGASRGQVFGLGAIESLLAVVVGVAAGGVLAWFVLGWVPNGRSQGSAVLGTAMWSLGGIGAVVTWVLWQQARDVSRPGHVVDRSGRNTRAISGPTLLLVLTGAVVAVWQLLRIGSPLVIEDDAYDTNLVAGAAPALLLAAAGVVALGLLTPISLLAVHAARSRRNATGFLTASQVARRIQVYAVPVVLTVLATGAVTIAGTYAGTSDQLRTDMQSVINGADVRAGLERPLAWGQGGGVPPTVPQVTDLDGVRAAAPVWLSDGAQIGDLTLQATASIPDLLRETAILPETSILLPDAFGSDETRVTGHTIVVPPGTKRLELHARGEMNFDGWGLAYFEQLPQMVVDEAEAMRQIGATVEADPQGVLAFEAESARSVLPIEVQVFLRDIDTGLGQFVSLGTIPLQGPTLGWDEETLSNFTTSASPVEVDLAIDLDPERRFAVDAVSLHTEAPDSMVLRWPRHFTVEMELAAGETQLFGTTTRQWASVQAADWDQAAERVAEREARVPEVEVVIEADEYGVSTGTASNELILPARLSTGDATWRLAASERSSEFFGTVISPAYTPANVDTHQPGAGPASQGTALVTLTHQAARAANLEVGQDFELVFRNRSLPATLVDLVDAVPGRTDPLAAFIDATTIGAQLASEGTSLSWPNELWVSTDGDPGTALVDLEQVEEFGEIAVAETGSPTDPTNAARLIFWVACAGATLLAATGIMAAATTMTQQRRSEVAVLRALGTSPLQQSLSRAAELAIVVAGSVVLGLAAGWLISALVVPSLAQATNAPGQVELTPGLHLEVVRFSSLLGFGMVLVGAVLMFVALRVHRQALDNQYREEVR